jgi:SAM-dependent methyltransferase
VSADIRTGQVWASGAQYERYVGRWSRLVAEELLRRLDVDAGGRWLDVGCGTGVLADAIRRRDATARIAGIDPSEAFVQHARGRVEGEFAVGDAQALPYEDASFDAAVSGLVLNFVPEPERAAAEMVRVVRPGGIVAAYVWDYAGEMQMIRLLFEAAAALDPAAAELDEGQRFPLCKPEPLRMLFAGTGVASVEVEAIDVPTVFADFDDFWEPFLGGQGPAPAYVSSLDDEPREALREHLRAGLPLQADGSIALRARAWAVLGRR